MISTSNITIAVSGLHRGENPQPGASVIASLRRFYENAHIIGLSYDPLESGLYSLGIDRVDTAYLMPFPHKGPNVLLERFEQINKMRKIDLVIPSLDSEIANYIEIQNQLQDLGIQSVLPDTQSLKMRSKQHLLKFCKQNKIPAPKTFWANDPVKLADYADEIGYPVYVKGKFYDAWEAHSREEVAFYFERISKTWGIPILVQESVIGEEYDVVGIGNGKGDLVASYPVRKILRSAKGKGFAGIVVNNEIINDLSKRIIKKLRWNGPFELEFIKETGKDFMLFEINPRFPAWVDFPSQLGCNMPAKIVEMALDLKSPKLKPFEAGEFFIRHCTDLVGNITELAELESDGEFLGYPIIIGGKRIQ